MKYSNLKITKEGNAKERSFGLTTRFIKNVKTNVGKVFLKLLKKRFPDSHILHKIFNLILHGGASVLPCQNFSFNIEKFSFEGFLKISGQ